MAAVLVGIQNACDIDIDIDTRPVAFFTPSQALYIRQESIISDPTRSASRLVAG
jgi:hypothetical protein